MVLQSPITFPKLIIISDRKCYCEIHYNSDPAASYYEYHDLANTQCSIADTSPD